MNFLVKINILPLEANSDPQGMALTQGMKTLGLEGVTEVNVGRHIQLAIHAADKITARAITETVCEGLLVNQVMEKYTYTIEEV